MMSFQTPISNLTSVASYDQQQAQNFDRVSGSVVAETQEIFKEWKHESISESL